MPTRWKGSNFSPTLAPCEFVDSQLWRRDFAAKRAIFFSASATAERSELSARELAAWSRLVAATGAAMLECLPQLRDGCVNYWEAGNWQLNDVAEPPGPKPVRDYRRVHLHVFGRSRDARHPAWLWGEAPAFPRFADRETWARDFRPLTSSECASIAAAITRHWRRLEDTEP